MHNALQIPATDPGPIFELQRGCHATELLVAAVHHLQVFELFAGGPVPLSQARARLGLSPRAAVVLFTALRAFGLLENLGADSLGLTALAREHLLGSSYFSVADYLGLAADQPGVLRMLSCLRSDKPEGATPQANAHASSQDGVAYIYRAGMDSAMEKQDSARRLTLALAGRARNVAPVLAQRLDLSGVEVLLDVGGGTGIYAIALLQKHPRLRAIIWDRPEVLKVAAQMCQDFGVEGRVELREGDMFTDAVPQGAQAILLSNILHDWDVPECQTLINRLAATLPPQGRLLIHDVFLNDAHDGPMATALYSATLFALTEGRAYSQAEYQAMLAAAGLRCGGMVPTLAHCGVLTGVST